MRKKIAFLILSILVIVCISACSGAPKTGSSNAKQLDRALREAAERIDERIEEGAKIALLNFSSPTTRFAEYVLNELEANILDYGRLLIIDRKELDLVRGELTFQMSGEVSDRSMQELGQMLGAKYVVSGSLTDLSGSHRMVIRVLTVETAAVAAQYRSDITNDSRVRSLLTGGGANTRPAAAAPAATTTTAATQTQTASAVPSGPLASGTYSFSPRLVALQGGMRQSIFIDRIVIHGQFMNIYLTRAATGGANNHSNIPYYGGTRSYIQDIANPQRRFSPVREAEVWEGSAVYWVVTFEGVQSRQFRLINTSQNPNLVFEEIILRQPNR